MSPYAPAKGFPQWFAMETPPAGDDSTRPLRWLVVTTRGLHISRSLEADEPKTVIGWTFDDDDGNDQHQRGAAQGA